MTTVDSAIPETAAVVEIAKRQPKLNTPSSRTADKRAEALIAKKKKKRAAHKVALRRSNTGG
jgi:hypothetical protein